MVCIVVYEITAKRKQARTTISLKSGPIPKGNVVFFPPLKCFNIWNLRYRIAIELGNIQKRKKIGKAPFFPGMPHWGKHEQGKKQRFLFYLPMSQHWVWIS
jgi:hypothetical protein